MAPDEAPGLDAAGLRADLPAGVVIGREILVFAQTGSTNDLARQAGDDGVAEGLTIFAETQLAGRGTQGRRWMSPPHRGLWFSVLLRPVSVPVERWPELTFCAALAVARTAELTTGQAARIKWPNDVLVSGRKVAGILVECHHRQTPGFVVVGIGLNVLQRLMDFEPALRERAGSLAMVTANGCELARHHVAITLLRQLESLYSSWPTAFPAIMEQCAQRGCASPTDAENEKGGS